MHSTVLSQSVLLPFTHNVAPPPFWLIILQLGFALHSPIAWSISVAPAGVDAAAVAITAALMAKKIDVRISSSPSLNIVISSV